MFANICQSHSFDHRMQEFKLHISYKVLSSSKFNTKANGKPRLYSHLIQSIRQIEPPGCSSISLFVFSIYDPKQNATSLLTPLSNTVFYALLSGTLSFALHGSSLNHFLIGGNSSTANQILSCKWLLKLPWRAKLRVPLERA